jgi:hypothetical protein
MLRIIEFKSDIETPMLYKLSQHISIQPGLFAQFRKLNKIDNVFVSDGSNPIGIIDDVRFGTDDSVYAHPDFVTVWDVKMIVETDMYDTFSYGISVPHPSYVKGCDLYVSPEGKVTPYKYHDECKVVGKVRTSPWDHKYKNLVFEYIPVS